MLCAALLTLVTAAHARLLTREEIAETSVYELSVPQLELEEQRVADQRWIWPAGLLIAFAGADSTAGSIFGVLTTWYLAASGSSISSNLSALVFGIVALGLIGSGTVLGLIGTGLMTALIERRQGCESRLADVRRHLEYIRAGELTPPEPERAAAFAELDRLESARPSYALPVVLLVAGVALAVAGAGLWQGARIRLPTNDGELGAGIALVIAGIASGGGGTYLAISTCERRQNIDASIDELKATPVQPVDDYWHF